jgi:tRNA A37 threonylcarbamoyladenosine synthetase subunit TsaC/SUA5/YrdC
MPLHTNIGGAVLKKQVSLPLSARFQKNLDELGPLILTSANPRGGTPKSITGHLPSTIIDFTRKTPKIIRQGNLVIDLEK